MNTKSTKVTLAEIATATETTIASWGLGEDGDRTIVLFSDGTINALAEDGSAIYDLARGNATATESLRRLYATPRLDYDDERSNDNGVDHWSPVMPE